MKTKQPASLSEFQKRVYALTKMIPKGKVTTYKTLGILVGCSSPRAIGQALKRNPFAPQVPCHRIVSSTLKIGGFEGKTAGTSIEKKKLLLQNEGITFDDEGQISKNCLWHPTPLSS